MPGHNDYSNYRKMQEPLESIDVANEALNKFYDAVENARNEYHICNVHFICKVIVEKGDGLASCLSSAHFGNSAEGMGMCAWGYEMEREAIRKTIKTEEK